MELPFDIGALGAPVPIAVAEPPPGVAVIALTAHSLDHGAPRHKQCVHELLNRLGEASALAQSLPGPITTGAKLAANANQTVYVAYDGRAALGFIKVGQKDLFIAQGDGRLVEIRPLCVLDFFVVSARRRQGVGRILFDTMMHQHGVESPAKLAYDRPSHMFLAFLARHFGLTSYTPQANNFVVFHDYFARPTAAATFAATALGGAMGAAVEAGAAPPAGRMTLTARRAMPPDAYGSTLPASGGAASGAGTFHMTAADRTSALAAAAAARRGTYDLTADNYGGGIFGGRGDDPAGAGRATFSSRTVASLTGAAATNTVARAGGVETPALAATVASATSSAWGMAATAADDPDGGRPVAGYTGRRSLAGRSASAAAAALAAQQATLASTTTAGAATGSANPYVPGSMPAWPYVEPESHPHTTLAGRPIAGRRSGGSTMIITGTGDEPAGPQSYVPPGSGMAAAGATGVTRDGRLVYGPPGMSVPGMDGPRTLAGRAVRMPPHEQALVAAAGTGDATMGLSGFGGTYGSGPGGAGTGMIATYRGTAEAAGVAASSSSSAAASTMHLQQQLQYVPPSSARHAGSARFATTLPFSTHERISEGDLPLGGTSGPPASRLDATRRAAETSAALYGPESSRDASYDVGADTYAIPHRSKMAAFATGNTASAGSSSSTSGSSSPPGARSPYSRWAHSHRDVAVPGPAAAGGFDASGTSAWGPSGADGSASATAPPPAGGAAAVPASMVGATLPVAYSRVSTRGFSLASASRVGPVVPPPSAGMEHTLSSTIATAAATPSFLSSTLPTSHAGAEAASASGYGAGTLPASLPVAHMASNGWVAQGGPSRDRLGFSDSLAPPPAAAVMGPYGLASGSGRMSMGGGGGGSAHMRSTRPW